MREIKFRIWNKINKVMNYEYPFFITLTGNIWLYHGSKEDFCQLKNEDFILMQYTGLKDKNGKEIYEDDVVKLFPKDKRKHSQIAVVKFDEDSLSFIGINGSSYFFLPQYEIELIGNIHEDFTLYEI